MEQIRSATKNNSKKRQYSKSKICFVHGPVELLHIFVGVHLGAVGGLVEEEVPDDAAVADVVLTVHRDGAGTGTAPHHTERKKEKEGDRIIKKLAAHQQYRGTSISQFDGVMFLTVRPSSACNKRGRAPFLRCSATGRPRTKTDTRRCCWEKIIIKGS